MIGKNIGDYKVLSEIGTGSYGIVFKVAAQGCYLKRWHNKSGEADFARPVESEGKRGHDDGGQNFEIFH